MRRLDPALNARLSLVLAFVFLFLALLMIFKGAFFTFWGLGFSLLAVWSFFDFRRMRAYAQFLAASRFSRREPDVFKDTRPKVSPDFSSGQALAVTRPPERSFEFSARKYPGLSLPPAEVAGRVGALFPSAPLADLSLDAGKREDGTGE